MLDERPDLGEVEKTVLLPLLSLAIKILMQCTDLRLEE